MDKRLRLFLVAMALLAFAGVSAHAICPVCTIAAGAGIGLFRYLGIDDAITGLWLGGFTVSLILWTLDWLDGKGIIYKGRAISVSLTYYLFAAWAVIAKGILGDPINQVLGVDKLCWGVTLGSLFFFAGARWYGVIKSRNGGHASFPFQKVVMPLAPIVVASLLLYIFNVVTYGK